MTLNIETGWLKENAGTIFASMLIGFMVTGLALILFGLLVIIVDGIGIFWTLGLLAVWILASTLIFKNFDRLF